MVVDSGPQKNMVEHCTSVVGLYGDCHNIVTDKSKKKLTVTICRNAAGRGILRIHRRESQISTIWEIKRCGSAVHGVLEHQPSEANGTQRKTTHEYASDFEFWKVRHAKN